MPRLRPSSGSIRNVKTVTLRPWSNAPTYPIAPNVIANGGEMASYQAPGHATPVTPTSPTQGYDPLGQRQAVTGQSSRILYESGPNGR